MLPFTAVSYTFKLTEYSYSTIGKQFHRQEYINQQKSIIIDNKSSFVVFWKYKNKKLANTQG